MTEPARTGPAALLQQAASLLSVVGPTVLAWDGRFHVREVARSESFCGFAAPLAVAGICRGDESCSIRFAAYSNGFYSRRPGSRGEVEGAAAVCAGALAKRHHAAARALDARSTTHIAHDVSVPGAARFFVDFVVHSEPGEHAVARNSARWTMWRQVLIVRKKTNSPCESWECRHRICLGISESWAGYDEYLDLRSLPPAEREVWKRKWKRVRASGGRGE